MRVSNGEILTVNNHRLRNITQRLIMGEIVRYADLFFTGTIIHKQRYWANYFQLKVYLYKKYKISF